MANYFPGFFKHSPLKDPRKFRLVQLHEEEESQFSDSSIKCSIHEVALDDRALRYRALSYCWGDQDKTTPILLNGERYFIGKDLETALRHFRTNKFHCCNNKYYYSNDSLPSETVEKHITSPNFLWVDILCISQDDTMEKNSQVSLMEEIYHRAEEVVIWLGEEGCETIPALRLLYGLAEIWHLEVDEAKPLISHVVKNEDFRIYWSALGKFLARPWWSRVWIVQEVVLARRAILVCGHWCAEWDGVAKATASFNECLDCMDEIIEADLFHQPKELKTFQTQAGKFKELKLLRHFHEHRRISRADFQALLVLSKNRYTSDPRDKVYGLLGLMTDLSRKTLLKADYSLTPCELYMQVCQVLYEQTKSLCFLSMVERNRLQNQNRKFDIPTWCPDWTIRTDIDPLFRDGSHPPRWSPSNPNSRKFTEKFSFTGDSNAQCAFHLPAKRLLVEGFIVDNIMTIEERWKDLIPDFSADGFTRYGKRICWHPPSPLQEFESIAFWSRWLKPEPCIKSRIVSAIKGTKQLNENHPLMKMSVFETEKYRYYGTTDALIQPGDSICALFGGNLPYILRKSKDSWVLVGQCIILQMMEGQIMAKLDHGAVTVQEFVLT